MNEKKMRRQMRLVQDQQAADARARAAASPRVDAKRFHPLRDLVLGELQAEKVSQGGIIIPDSIKEPALPIFNVVEVGAEVRAVKPGDLVLFSLSDGRALDGTYFLVEEKKIACRVDPKSVIETRA